MKKTTVRILTIAVVAVILIVILVSSGFKAVPTGYTGIMTTFGRVSDTNLDAGIHVKLPWQKIVLMDNRVQKATIATQAFSSDIQQVDVQLTANYSINKSAAAALYKSVGTGYYDSIIYPRLLEDLKAILANYTAEGLVENRSQLAEQVKDKMTKDMTSYGIDVHNIAIEDLDFSDRFTDAIEAKQVATQELQRATTEQEQATMEERAAAERRQIAAESDAAVARVEADAEAYSITTKANAEAEANSKIAASVTRDLIDYRQALNWDGKLPATYMGEGSAMPVIGVTGTTEKTDSNE